ncbi:MAG: uroporphyrinogen-III synthase [Yoonia sp.]|nr:uroporphyrinogen-III synthase [Yoonia sp.]
MQPTLIITRPAPDGATFAAAFPRVRVLLSPLQRIDPVDVDCFAKGVIFTSTNGVAQAERLGMTSGPAWCVGDRTAQAAQAAGFDAVSAGGDVEDLLKLILTDCPAFPLAHVRGRDARGDLAPRLRAAGIDCADCVAYNQTPVPMTASARQAIDGAEPVIIPLFSPRAAALLLDQVTIKENVTLVAISKNVASALGQHRSILADRPDGPAMLEATKHALATL